MPTKSNGNSHLWTVHQKRDSDVRGGPGRARMREAGARGWAVRAASARTARTGTRRAASGPPRRPRRLRAGSHAGKPPGRRCLSPWCRSWCCSCHCGCHPSRLKSRTRRMVTCLNCLTSFAEERSNFPRTHPLFHSPNALVFLPVSPVSVLRVSVMLWPVWQPADYWCPAQRHLCVNQWEADNPATPASPASTATHHTQLITSSARQTDHEE